MKRLSFLNRIPPKDKTILLLSAIIILAAALRFWNVGFDSDLNRYFSGDGKNKFYNTKYLVTAGEVPEKVLPRNLLYRQPMFLLKSYGWIWKAVDLAGFDTNDSRMRKGFTAYMILFSLGTVALVYFLGNLVIGSQNAGLYAALLFAVFPVNVMGSLYVKEDIPLMFWFTGAILAMSALVKTSQQRYYFIIGILIGMAVSTKYPGLLLLPVFLLVHLMVVLNFPREQRLKGLLNWRFFAALLVASLVFLAINFHVITEWNDFVEGFKTQVIYASEGHHDGTIIRGVDYLWTFYLRYAILPGITLAVTGFMFAGFVFAFVRKNQPAILISIVVIFFYFYFENSPAKPFPFFARYLNIIYPLMAVLAALTFFELWGYLKRRPLTKVLGIMVGVVLVIQPFATSLVIAAGVNPDTRITAVKWMEQNLPPGVRIYEGPRTYCPRVLKTKRFYVKYDDKIYLKTAQKLAENDFQYLVLCSIDYDRYRYSQKSSEVSREAYSAFLEFERELQLVKMFKPEFPLQSYGFHNPIIKIYRIPQS